MTVNNPKFFIVHASFTIAGSSYRPGVCYPLSARLKPTVEDLAKQDLATLFNEEVRIVSGQAYPLSGGQKSRPAGLGAAAAPSAGSSPQAGSSVVLPQNQGKRDFD